MKKLFIAIVFVAVPALAQPPIERAEILMHGPSYMLAQSSEQQGEDPLAKYLYPPDLVLDNQRQINLMPAERLKIQEAVLDAQKKFVGLQFVMSQETEKLKDLLRSAIVEEAAVLKQIDTMLGVEREVKRAQLSLMIKIKNLLSNDQKAALDKIRGR